jgi:uncharacterized protein (TIGR00369 family)
MAEIVRGKVNGSRPEAPTKRLDTLTPMAVPDLASDQSPKLPAASPIGEPVRGGHSDPELLALPGLEQLRRQIAGEVPEAPLSRLTGMRLVSVEPGTASFRMPLTPVAPCPVLRPARGMLTIPADAAMACAVMSQPALHTFTGITVASADDGAAVLTLPASAWFCAPPAGRVQVGIVALLTDQALSQAVATVIPARSDFALVELKLNLLRPLASDGRLARAESRVVHAGRRIAVATAEVTDAAERTIAIASGSGLIGTAE